jgi:mono/diheme cytochrome c family protein
MSREATIVGLLLCLVGCLGCQQEMARQPYYRPLQFSEFFADGRSERPEEPGTVARGYLRVDRHLHAGETDGGLQPADVAALVGMSVQPLEGLATFPAATNRLVDTFPFLITEAVLRRGRERFNIYCAVCHDRVGTGNGRIVQRGYVRPPSYHIDRLRLAPVGYIFQVITRGHGAMPDYAAQIVPSDRWAIVGYVRALQRSQYFPAAELPPEARQLLAQEK